MSYSVLSIETSARLVSREYNKKATHVCMYTAPPLSPHTCTRQTCGIWWLCGDSRDSYCDWTAEGDPHMISIDTSTLRGCGWEVGLGGGGWLGGRELR